MTRARSSMRRFSGWLSCFLFITRPWLRADSRTAVLITLHSHHRSISVDVHLLLQVGRGGTGTHLQPARQRLTPNELGVGSHRIEQRSIPIDPELDPVHVGIAGVLTNALHPVDDLPREALAAQRLAHVGIQTNYKRPIALAQPVARH